MRSLIYIAAVLLVIGWVIGFFAFHFGPVIHVLLVAAFVVFVLTIFGERKMIE